MLLFSVRNDSLSFWCLQCGVDCRVVEVRISSRDDEGTGPLLRGMIYYIYTHTYVSLYLLAQES